jgi:hypothetical protein
MLNLITAALLVIFATLSRIVPHPANFTPIVAIALFSGVYFNKKWAFIIPVAAMLISDAIIGFHSGMIWVYGSFIIIALVGLWLKSHKKTGIIFGSTIASSVIFFVITNFGVWLTGYYSLTFSGLVQCYTMAIPFFRNSIAGDLIYAAVMFGIYELLIRLVLKPVPVKNEVKK